MRNETMLLELFAFGRPANWVFYISYMLTAVQRKHRNAGNVAKEAYTVEEVFDRIGYKLVDVFGEDFKKKLNKGRAELDMLPL